MLLTFSSYAQCNSTHLIKVTIILEFVIFVNYVASLKCLENN